MYESEQSAEWTVGDLVEAEYKSGAYIGEVTEIARNGRLVVRVLSVLRHPEQGDLHHHGSHGAPGLYHTRRALGYREEALIPGFAVRRYAGDVPDYAVSRAEALRQMKQRILASGGEDKEAALACAAELEQDYGNSGT